MTKYYRAASSVLHFLDHSSSTARPQSREVARRRGKQPTQPMRAHTAGKLNGLNLMLNLAVVRQMTVYGELLKIPEVLLQSHSRASLSNRTTSCYFLMHPRTSGLPAAFDSSTNIDFYVCHSCIPCKQWLWSYKEGGTTTF